MSWVSCPSYKNRAGGQFVILSGCDRHKMERNNIYLKIRLLSMCFTSKMRAGTMKINTWVNILIAWKCKYSSIWFLLFGNFSLLPPTVSRH